jgi:hypothetical protein
LVERRRTRPKPGTSMLGRLTSLARTPAAEVRRSGLGFGRRASRRPCIDVAQSLEVRRMKQIDAGRNEREQCRAGQKEDPRHDRAPTSPGGYAEESSHRFEASARSAHAPYLIPARYAGSAEKTRKKPFPRGSRDPGGSSVNRFVVVSLLLNASLECKRYVGEGAAVVAGPTRIRWSS